MLKYHKINKINFIKLIKILQNYTLTVPLGKSAWWDAFKHSGIAFLFGGGDFFFFHSVYSFTEIILQKENNS